MHRFVAAIVTLVTLLLAGGLQAKEPYDSGIAWLEPPVVAPASEPNAPPSDAVVLVDGTDLSQWRGGEG